jgi:hypothetical protein
LPYHVPFVLLEVNVMVVPTRSKILCVLVVASLTAGSFGFGFVACLHLKRAGSDDLRQRYLLKTGDAPPSVRAEVVAVLRAFQEGYIKRDPKELDSFMDHLFPANDDILLLGTDADEWVRGNRAVGEFIKSDWAKWGDFRFAADDSIVWSSGEVAWIASVGVVKGKLADRPLRFSAILTRQGGKWLFRQLQFQWDDRDPRPSDVFRASTYLRLVRLALRHVGITADSGHASRAYVVKEITARNHTESNKSIGLAVRYEVRTALF